MTNTAPCGWCGVPTSSPSRTCTNCCHHALHVNDPHHWTDALYGGEWVNDKGVQRWVPWERVLRGGSVSAPNLREWALANGITCGERGRIPAAVHEAYADTQKRAS